ncbi:beta-glucan synthesis-associated [Mycena rebaudengoi]|nr:beta-glucan synthesis-associated [Mycena rebaudengoi]
MVLYRLADEPDRGSSVLSPPRALGSGNRANGTSIASLASASSLPGDSKYPAGLPHTRGLGAHFERSHSFPWRGIANVAVLLILILILALLALFVSYPVISYIRDRPVSLLIEGNIRINKTGQVAEPPNVAHLRDPDTPSEAFTRTGFDGGSYSLVFSDDFNKDGSTFYPGDDPYWEAVDIWYGSTVDLEWYDPSQVTTRDGHLIITMDSADTTPVGTESGSTAPFTVDNNHNLTYRSGMLQSWNKFCFTRGYIEVAISIPGPNSQNQGYWPGAWTMGNLARPGYLATSDGTWPYTYSTCDLGTSPNQTLADGSGPAAALHSDESRKENDFRLSWLPGQRLSACSCPKSDHPGPDPSTSSKRDTDTSGQVVSQSVQVAPFTRDYLYTEGADGYQIFDNVKSVPNGYKVSAGQQAISALTSVPDAGFQGSGAQFVKYGFEYWSGPKKPDSGYVTWQVDGVQSARVGAGALGPDMGTDGSQVGRRLIPLEPMSIVLNLGISKNWQDIKLETMVFPAEMLVDYVRVYQRDGETNIGCNPSDFPTTDYIKAHYEAYSNPNITQWPWDRPRNSLFNGGC